MKKVLVSLAVAVMCLVGCSSTKNVDLTGSWHIDDAYGVSTENGMNEAVIEFSGSNNVNGNASINTFFGSYSLKEDGLTLSNLGITKMMGANIEIEDAVVKGLNTVKKCSVNGDKAVFFDAEGNEIMHLTKK